MELNRLYNCKLISINKSIDKIEMIFENLGLKFIVKFEGHTFETTSLILGKRLLHYSNLNSLGMKSIDYLRKNRITDLKAYKQLTFEFENEGHYKNEIICLYKNNVIDVKNYR